MQAAIDGRAEPLRTAKPPFIEPALLRAGFDMSGDALVWFSVWNESRNLAIAIDISSDEVEPCEHSLRSGRRAWGDHYAGPFPSRQQAEAFAVERLRASATQFGLGRYCLDVANQGREGSCFSAIGGPMRGPGSGVETGSK
jgi:hypothetical protein